MNTGRRIRVPAPSGPDIAAIAARAVRLDRATQRATRVRNFEGLMLLVVVIIFGKNSTAAQFTLHLKKPKTELGVVSLLKRVHRTGFGNR